MQSVVATELKNGDLVFAFNAPSTSENGNHTIWLQHFDQTGSVRQTTTQIPQTYSLRKPSITALDGGGYAVSGIGRVATSDFGYVWQFDSNGNILPEPTQKLLPTYIDQSNVHINSSEVVALEGGGWVVTWDRASENIAIDNSDIFTQVFNSKGEVVNTFTVNNTTVGPQKSPRIASLPSGGYLITWLNYEGSSVSEIRGQQFNSNGDEVRSEFSLSGEVINYDVQTLPDGGYIITYTRVGDNSSTDLYAQRFNTNNSTTSDPIRVFNNSTQGNPDDIRNSVSVNEFGDIFISWDGTRRLTEHPFSTFSTTNFQIFSIAESSGLIESGSLMNTNHANAALAQLEESIQTLSYLRASYGANINRLEYSVDNLTNIAQNTEAARFRILDTDYAKETTELARTQIIQQAATAMLTQANQQAQQVLELLKAMDY